MVTTARARAPRHGAAHGVSGCKPHEPSHRSASMRGVTWKRDRKLTDEEIGVAFVRRLNGTSMKALVRECGVSRFTLFRAFRRFATHLAKHGTLPKGRPSVLERSKGPQRLHLAEAVLDLYELVHFRSTGDEVTLRTLQRVVGASNDETGEETAWHRFYELRKALKRYGLHLGKRLAPGSPSRMDARLVFSLWRVRAFVNRELDAAEQTLGRFKDRAGLKGRFRGRGPTSESP